MFKLVKFEFLRKRMTFAIAGGLAVLAQLYALYQYFKLDTGVRQYLGGDIFGVFMGLTLFGLAIVYFIDIILLFKDDLFKQEGYMLFMTPVNGYGILGSKLVFALLEGLVIAMFYVLLFVLNFNIMHVGNFSLSLADIDTVFITTSLKALTLGVLGLVEFALTVYLSFALFKSLFNNTRMKGLITFAIFIGVNIVKSNIVSMVGNLIGANFETVHISSVNMAVESVNIAINYGLVALLVSAIILFIGTGYLLENKINL